jgi:hypothetical protein
MLDVSGSAAGKPEVEIGLGSEIDEGYLGSIGHSGGVRRRRLDAGSVRSGRSASRNTNPTPCRDGRGQLDASEASRSPIGLPRCDE